MSSGLYKAREELAEKLDLPRDIILDIPKITIVGDNEITIENHKGIIIFDNNEVKVNSNVGCISIKGEKFEIRYIGGSTITISGKFKSAIYEGNG
jgi:sporulation protein YqfC